MSGSWQKTEAYSAGIFKDIFNEGTWVGTQGWQNSESPQGMLRPPGTSNSRKLEPPLSPKDKGEKLLSESV